jgi:hypothetical protein
MADDVVAAAAVVVVVASMISCARAAYPHRHCHDCHYY